MASRRLFGSKVLQSIFAAACAAVVSMPVPLGAVDIPAPGDIDDWNIPFWEQYWEEYLEELAELEGKNGAMFAFGNGADALRRGTGSGEWPWWRSPEDASQKTLYFDNLWNVNVDEYGDDRQAAVESRNKKGGILYDRRSCENKMTVKACKKWLATPHEILSLPSRAASPSPILKHKQTDSDKELARMMKDKIDEMRYRARWKMKGAEDPWVNDPNFYGCPFDTAAECMVWKTKPAVIETVSDRKPVAFGHAMDSVIVLARAGNRITPTIEDSKPLISRYRTLLAASRACCTGGIVHNMESAGASRETVMSFIMNDANLNRFGERCLMTTDKEINKYSSDLLMAEMVMSVRDACLCRRKEFYETLLAPFAKISEASDEFASSPFNITYLNGMKRKMTVDANAESRTVLGQLKNCR